MGTPVNISEVAKYMIARSGREIPITYTGLRKGEKLSEVLISENEKSSRPFHPLISHATVVALSPEILNNPFDERRLAEAMKTLCFHSSD
jgi:dTDP-glucose 4,6-dehydratase